MGRKNRVEERRGEERMKGTELRREETGSDLTKEVGRSYRKGES